MAFSSEDWINRFSGDASLLDIWDELDCYISMSVHFAVSRVNNPSRLAGTTFASSCGSV
jgi:hypothetical protein